MEEADEIGTLSRLGRPRHPDARGSTLPLGRFQCGKHASISSFAANLHCLPGSNSTYTYCDGEAAEPRNRGWYPITTRVKIRPSHDDVGAKAGLAAPTIGAVPVASALWTSFSMALKCSCALFMDVEESNVLRAGSHILVVPRLGSRTVENRRVLPEILYSVADESNPCLDSWIA